jgi:glycerol-3-phosphate acyltransferase PlsY
MKLTWRDAYITVFAGAVVIALVAALLGYDWSLFASWKGAVATVGALGVLMLLSENRDLFAVNVWGILEWVLFVGAIGLAIAGLIVSSKVIFILLCADILAFWLTSVARHIFSHETHVRHISFPAT